MVESSEAERQITVVKCHMVQLVLAKKNLGDSSAKEDLAFWLSRSPDERVEALNQMRREAHGNSIRLQRVVRITQFPKG